MSDEDHYRKLERMYLSAPINEYYQPSVSIGDGYAEIAIPMRRDFWHAADAVHGSVYFKAMDDAAFFAANSKLTDGFALTVSFTVHFIRPIVSGTMTAKGRLVHAGATVLIAEADVTDEDGTVVGKGSGTFVKSRIPLTSAIGYA